MLIIRQRSKVKECRNSASGHTWVEETPIKIWDLYTDVGVVDTFRSYEAAKTAYDTWKAYQEKFPFEIPRTKKEIDYVHSNKLP